MHILLTICQILNEKIFSCLEGGDRWSGYLWLKEGVHAGGGSGA